MNEYEMMTIIHPRLNADDAAAAVTAVEEQIVANGGELLSTDVWGRRRLAYPIDGVTDGTYVLMTFKMPPTGTATLERGLRISESVLRHLLIRGIIPFEGGRDERDDRDDRRDRDDRDERYDDRDDDRDDRPRDRVAPADDRPGGEAEPSEAASDGDASDGDATNGDAGDGDTSGDDESQD